MLHIKQMIIWFIYSIRILPLANALCLCRRKCSVICSEIARHMQGGSPRGNSQQKGHAGASFLKHQGRMAFLLQLIPSFPHRSYAKSLEGKEREDYNSLQQCGIRDVFLQEQGHGEASWEGSSSKSSSVF